MSANQVKTFFTPKRLRVLRTMATGVVVPTIPVLLWWKWSSDQRSTKLEDAESKVRVPNVQTVDDLLIERCRPGDVVLFDRRWESCAAGPLAALSCLLGRAILCWEDQSKVISAGKFDHCGIVVPGYAKSKKEALDPSNLLLLEATAGGGIVARPLLARLEVSQSRSVILLPLAIPGERRRGEDVDGAAPPSVVASEILVRKNLEAFRDQWTNLSVSKKYQNAHSTLGIVGALLHVTGMNTSVRAPTSPAAWFVAMALQDAKVAQPVLDENLRSTKVEDFLRDYRFQDQNVVRLRPGWRFLPPVSMREN